MTYNFFRTLTPMARVLALATVAALVLGHSHVHAGLVARWTLDDNGADATVLSDFNSPADDGTFRHIGDPAGVTTADHSVPGQIGSALNFDGITDKVTTGFAGPSGADARSVSVWVKGSKIDQNSFPQVLAWGGFPGNNGGFQGGRWSVRIKEPDVPGDAWAARIEVNNGGLNGTIDVLDDQWNNIVTTWDGTLAKIYVNGVFNNDPNGNANLPINTATDFNVSIGFAESFPDETPFRFKGMIDDVRIYDHALSQSEIDDLQIIGQDGDFDGDGDVDGADFLKWQRDLGDAANLTLWEDNFGTPAAVNAVSAVPEPKSAALLGLALLGIIAAQGWRRRLV